MAEKQANDKARAEAKAEQGKIKAAQAEKEKILKEELKKVEAEENKQESK